MGVSSIKFLYCKQNIEENAHEVRSHFDEKRSLRTVHPSLGGYLLRVLDVEAISTTIAMQRSTY